MGRPFLVKIPDEEEENEGEEGEEKEEKKKKIRRVFVCMIYRSLYIYMCVCDQVGTNPSRCTPLHLAVCLHVILI
jgi:hypothetical protein